MLTIIQIEQLLKENDKFHQEHSKHIQDLREKVNEHDKLLNKEETKKEIQ
jgi:hypothetical protein